MTWTMCSTRPGADHAHAPAPGSCAAWSVASPDRRSDIHKSGNYPVSWGTEMTQMATFPLLGGRLLVASSDDLV